MSNVDDEQEVPAAPSDSTAIVPGTDSPPEANGDTADDLAWLGLEVHKAQRQINRGASEMA